MGNNSNGNIGFPSLLYVNFCIKKKYRVDETAKKMQIATDTLYRYVRGENTMPPDRIIDLIKATGDIEYLEFFSEPCGFIPINASSVSMTKAEREKHELHLAGCMGLAIEAIERAYEDGKVEKNEYEEIRPLLSNVRRLAAELDNRIKGEVKC